MDEEDRTLNMDNIDSKQLVKLCYLHDLNYYALIINMSAFHVLNICLQLAQ